MWDGNNPLYEWVDYKQAATQTTNAQNTRQQDANADTAAIASRNALSTALDHQVPPSSQARFTPSEDYSRGYDGVLVKLTTKPGTSAKLQEIGIAANKPAADALSLPEGKGPWNMEHARFKAERGIINTQLGTSKIIDGEKTEGKALEVFNDNLIDFEQLSKDTT